MSFLMSRKLAPYFANQQLSSVAEIPIFKPSLYSYYIIISEQRVMSKDFYSKLLNSMAYGAVSKIQMPSDLDDYTVTLVRQYYRNAPPEVKLKFVSKLKSLNNPDYYLKIDDVREPANAMFLIKYSESEGNVTAKPVCKVRSKLIMSVEKEIPNHEDLVEESEKEEDSDIPKRPYFKMILQTEDAESQGKIRKRLKNNDDDNDDDEDN